MSRGIEGELHCSKKVTFIMEDIHKAVETGEFTGLSDKIFWRVYAAYQDGQMEMLIKQQERRREEAQETAKKIDALPEDVCGVCGGRLQYITTPACTCNHPREVNGGDTPPAV